MSFPRQLAIYILTFAALGLLTTVPTDAAPPQGKRSASSSPQTSISYSTFLGGSLNEYATAMATDAEGNIYVTGYTNSPDLQVTAGAFQQTFKAGLGADSFAAKFDPNGALIYCTYLGGTGDDRALAIAVDRGGNAYISGSTTSRDFPVSEGALVRPNTSFNPAPFVAKLSAAGALLAWVRSASKP